MQAKWHTTLTIIATSFCIRRYRIVVVVVCKQFQFSHPCSHFTPRIESSFCSYHEPTFKFFNPKLFTNQPPTFSPTLFPSRRKVLFLFFNNVFLLCPDLFQVIFIHVESNNEDAGKPVADYFGITGNDPKVIISRLFFILFLWLSHGILLLLFCSRLFCIHKKWWWKKKFAWWRGHYWHNYGTLLSLPS